jgi:hypothetical protein
MSFSSKIKKNPTDLILSLRNLSLPWRWSAGNLLLANSVPYGVADERSDNRQGRQAQIYIIHRFIIVFENITSYLFNRNL